MSNKHLISFNPFLDP